MEPSQDGFMRQAAGLDPACWRFASYQCTVQPRLLRRRPMMQPNSPAPMTATFMPGSRS
jgi:hypothetical protein